MAEFFYLAGWGPWAKQEVMTPVLDFQPIFGFPSIPPKTLPQAMHRFRLPCGTGVHPGT